MNVFMQGMRRSGTTILFDIFSADGDFDCYYEPFAAAKKAIGGGSGVQNTDLFAKVRRSRAAFLAANPQFGTTARLNYGAPRKPELELETAMPDYCREYIRHMISRSPRTAIKFTRVYAKIRALWEIDPKAKLIHIVRDPRSVTASYLFGKNLRRRHIYANERLFFRRRSTGTGWSSRAFSELLLNTAPYAHLRGCANYMRVLLLWKHIVRRTHELGSSLFGDNYTVFRHEDLCRNPSTALYSLFEFLGRRPKPHVIKWAERYVKPARAPFAAQDARWGAAFRRLQMKEELTWTGYTSCLDLCRSRSSVWDFLRARAFG